MAGIYFHIPFCKQACYYCDFHFSTNHQRMEEMVSAMVAELHLQKEYLGKEKIQTIYFGGGTPSLLTETEISALLDAVHKTHSVMHGAEITLEANPDDLTKSNLIALKKAGINRLSIGIQSLQNDLLKSLNRSHDAETAMASYVNARSAGFTNISVDLIFTLPGLTHDQWLGDIQKIVSLNPEHISCYSLTIEEKTVFGKWASTGKLIPVDDDLSARQFELLMDQLEAHDYEQYEISNFAKPGFYSRHNSSYWRQEKYLGIGPSAHSYNKTHRHFNIRNNHKYIAAIQAGTLPVEVEQLSTENKINEYVLTTLRTCWGTDLNKIQNEYHFDLLKKNSEYIQSLLNRDMANLNDGILTLTRKGKLLADKIASDLFVEKV